MSGKLSSRSVLPRFELFTQSTATTILNSSSELVITERQSKIQRWIFGMIIGSAPFLFILFCWMFVSLCINNLVRIYRHTKKRYRYQTSTERIEDSSPMVNA